MKKNQKKIQLLTCAVCSKETKGQQWFNQDTGFGLCDSCIPFVQKYEAYPGELKQSFGIAGTHFGILQLEAE